MDVKATLSAVACIIALSACSNQKSVNSVFPENDSLDSAACKGQAVENRYIVQWEDGRFTVEEAENLDKFKEEFIKPKLEQIKLVEFDRQIQAQELQTTVEPMGNEYWNLERTRVPEVWAEGFYGQGVKVAVVDSYVEVTNPQINPQIAVNTGEIPNNGIDDDNNGVVDDYLGASFVSSPDGGAETSPHGTHVSGTIVANPNFGSARGAAPAAKLIPAQFISNGGGGYLGDAILALQYSVKRGAKIINASWGGAPCVASLRDAFYDLEKNGILVVVAAGNEGRDIDYTPSYPAAFNVGTQITVAASTELDIMAGWSNVGFSLVHIAAPGSNIFSTIPGGTAFFDGTSMAAPLVSGVAALIWSARPDATAKDIKKAILESASVTQNREFKTQTRGRLDAQAALQKLKSLVP